MKFIYSTQSVVEYDGVHYYSNAVASTYRRYKLFDAKLYCICYLKEVEMASETLIEDGEIEFVPVTKLNTILSLVKYRKQNERIVKKLVSTADACFVHIPATHSYDVIKYSKRYNVPYMTVVVGCSWDSMWNYNWKGKLLAFPEFLALRKAQYDSPYSIYVTNQFLQKRYPTTGKWIACSNVNVSTGLDGVLDKRLAHINSKFTSGDILKIGTAAALDVPYKGQIYVIRALAKLKAEGILFEYHLVGKGTGEQLKVEANKLGVGNQLFIHGLLEHNRVLEFLDDMDIYIQPSKQEGLPRALIEAMSRGCLCLGSKIAGIPELLEKDFLFNKGCVGEIVNRLRNIGFESYIQQAKVNFSEAKKYNKETLNSKRQKFIFEFLKSIEN